MGFRLTTRIGIGVVGPDMIAHIVDPSDPTDDPSGSSFKAVLSESYVPLAGTKASFPILGDVQITNAKKIYTSGPTNTSSITWGGSAGTLIQTTNIANPALYFYQNIFSNKIEWSKNGNIIGSFTNAENFGIGQNTPGAQYQINSKHALSIKGNFNLFAGEKAGDVNAGDENTFLGSGAGEKNTNGTLNTFVGDYAGNLNTTGANNTFVGSNAFYTILIGTNNVGVGSGVGGVSTGSYNTFIGSNTATFNTTGEENVFIGYAAGEGNTTQSGNTYIGTLAGTSSVAVKSVFIGYAAGALATALGENVFIGYIAGNVSTDGRCTFVGFESGKLHTSGQFNTALGWQSAIALSTGTHNTFLGGRNGTNCTTGTFNTFVGYAADFTNNTQRTKSVAIGYNAAVNQDNCMVLGGTGADALNVTIGQPLSTARFHLPAGTATASSAPLKFESGTNLTAVENGAVEYNGTNYFISSGGVRYTIDRVLTGSATLDFPNTTGGNTSDLTITVTGAASGDCVGLGVPNASVASANAIFTAWVSAADTVTVRFSNTGAGALNPASGTFKVIVSKTI